jgi:hypothetical protein
MQEDKRIPKGGMADLRKIMIKFEPSAKSLIKMARAGTDIGTEGYTR